MQTKYQFSEEQYKEIRAACQKNRDKQIGKKPEVLELRCEGMRLSEIAKAARFHRSYVSSLIRKYFEEGLDSVSEKHRIINRDEMLRHVSETG